MAAHDQFEAQSSLYDYRWHLYQNSIFDDNLFWTNYRRKYGLYRYIRSLYNPTRRLVDFYAGHLPMFAALPFCTTITSPTWA